MALSDLIGEAQSAAQAAKPEAKPNPRWYCLALNVKDSTHEVIMRKGDRVCKIMHNPNDSVIGGSCDLMDSKKNSYVLIDNWDYKPFSVAVEYWNSNLDLGSKSFSVALWRRLDFEPEDHLCSKPVGRSASLNAFHSKPIPLP